MVANQGSRRLRACILGVIPGDVTEAAVRQCEITQSSTVDISPESLKKLLSTFLSDFRVTQAQIEKRIQRRIESIRPAQFLQLRKIYQSLRDGMSGTEDWFDSDYASPAPAATTFNHPENDVATGNVEEEKPVEKPASDNDWYAVFTTRIADSANTSETEVLQRELEYQKHTIDINQYSELKGKITKQKFRLSAVNRIEKLLKDLPRPGEPDAAGKFATLESTLNASKTHLAELHEAYSIRLNDMKPEYVG